MTTTPDTGEHDHDDVPAGDVTPRLGLAVRWQGFRAFKDTRWVPLKPLSVFIGANSAGKSSAIAPLLLMKQSLLSRTGRNALLTTGDYIRAGLFSDMVLDHRVENELTFGLRWHSHRRPRKGAPGPVGEYPPGGARFSFSEGDDARSTRLTHYVVEDLYRRPMLVRRWKGDNTYSMRMATPPDAFRRPSSKRKPVRQARAAAKRAMRDAVPQDFLFTSSFVRQALHPQHENDSPTFPAMLDDDRVRFYCQITDYVQWELQDLFYDMYYVGPLREAPKRVYEISGEMPPDVGTRGQFAPEIAYRWLGGDHRFESLKHWWKHFEFEEDLDFEQIGTGGFTMRLARNGRPVATTLVDTGFGMSQVLPLIVQGLMAPQNSWIITEQPEIHLNPRLQAKLADLFAAVVDRQVGVIVETHSEHLLLRLRRLVAEEKIDSRNVGLYFVERTGGESRIREVPISKTGFIDPNAWPEGFFEDGLQEAIALAEAQAEAAARSGAEDR